jgi:hypothetical protein
VEKEDGRGLEHTILRSSSLSSEIVKSAFDETVCFALMALFFDKYFSALSSAELFVTFLAVVEGEEKEEGVGGVSWFAEIKNVFLWSGGRGLVQKYKDVV